MAGNENQIIEPDNYSLILILAQIDMNVVPVAHSRLTLNQPIERFVVVNQDRKMPSLSRVRAHVEIERRRTA